MSNVRTLSLAGSIALRSAELRAISPRAYHAQSFELQTLEHSTRPEVSRSIALDSCMFAMATAYIHDTRVESIAFSSEVGRRRARFVVRASAQNNHSVTHTGNTPGGSHSPGSLTDRRGEGGSGAAEAKAPSRWPRTPLAGLPRPGQHGYRGGSRRPWCCRRVGSQTRTPPPPPRVARR